MWIAEVREPLSEERLREFLEELARSAPRGSRARVFLVGGSTAVWAGWRASTVDVDLHGEPEGLFRDIQAIKERLNVNVEFARPGDFVPELPHAEDRHVFLETIGSVSFFHHDPYEQTLSKIVRGFERDLDDARHFVDSGMVDPHRLKDLVHGVPADEYARYPQLSRDAVLGAVDTFVEEVR